MFHVHLPVDTQVTSEVSPNHCYRLLFIHETIGCVHQTRRREQGIQLPVLHTVSDHSICHGDRPLGCHMSRKIFFRLVKHLLWKLNQTQPTNIYLDVSVSIRGLRQKEMELILLPVLATVVMWCGKKSVVRARHSFRMCTASLIHLVPLSDSLSRTVCCLSC